MSTCLLIVMPNGNMYRYIIVLLLLISPPTILKANTLIVAISDFPPWIDVSAEKYGVHGVVILDALDKAKVSYEIRLSSWSRVERMLNTEDICSFGWIKNRQRLEAWQYSRPYHSDITYLWGRKDNRLSLHTIEDALKYRIGVTRGYSYGQLFDELLAKAETNKSLDDTVNLRLLLAGRIDLFPGQVLLIEPLLAAHFPKQADELEPKLEVNRLKHHFVCNKDSELGRQVIHKINRFLPAVTDVTSKY